MPLELAARRVRLSATAVNASAKPILVEETSCLELQGTGLRYELAKQATAPLSPWARACEGLARSVSSPGVKGVGFALFVVCPIAARYLCSGPRMDRKQPDATPGGGAGPSNRDDRSRVAWATVDPARQT
jgi:hypothetical protein